MHIQLCWKSCTGINTPRSLLDVLKVLWTLCAKCTYGSNGSLLGNWVSRAFLEIGCQEPSWKLRVTNLLGKWVSRMLEVIPCFEPLEVLKFCRRQGHVGIGEGTKVLERPQYQDAHEHTAGTQNHARPGISAEESAWRTINGHKPFTRKSGRFQISHAASHNLAFRSLLGWKMILLPILTTSLIHISFKGCENVLFELGSERVGMEDDYTTNSN